MRQKGFTLVEIMIVVAIIGLLAAIAIPNFIRARATTQQNACINNLRLIDGAKEQYAIENRLSDDADVATTQVNTYLKRISVPDGGGDVCPGGGTYTIGVIGTTPSCTLSTNTYSHVLPNE